MGKGAERKPTGKVTKELRRYLEETREEGKSAGMRETIILCRGLTREQRRNLAEERTTFMQYLSDIFRIDGREIVLLQVLMLLVCILGLSAVSDVLALLPVFAPLFVLGTLPVLFRGQAYNMTEMEAATRASGAQAVLAKLILAGAANLVCMTFLLGWETISRNETEDVGRMILYILVPYLICLVSALWSLRKRSKDGMQVSLAFTIFLCLGFGVLAKVCPLLYEASAVEVWLILFVVSLGFFVKELQYILCVGKGGLVYGTVD